MRSLILACSVVLTVPSGAAAAPRVEFQLVTERGFSVSGQQRWLRLLGRLGDRVRIRRGRGSVKLEVKNTGTPRAPSYVVTGVLTAQNRLRVQGASFRLSESGRIEAWLKKLKADGPDSLTAPTGAFGLTAKQLVAVHEALAKKVSIKTKGRRTFEAAEKIAAQVRYEFAIDPAAERKLQGSKKVADELVGLSSGTALAALLRPLGLVLMPEKPRGRPVQLAIVEYKNARESWPVGWPPKKPAGRAFPRLFNKLNVSIDDRPMTEVLGAVAGRLKVPFLIDHNSLARQRIEIDQLRVSLPEKRTYYHDILRKSLRQGKLKYELRMDEADGPLVWITTQIPASVKRKR